MPKIILYIAASIDGYIAKPDGNIDFLHNPVYEIKNEDFGYHLFYDNVSTTIMGNATYQEVLGFDVPFPYPDKENFVFSRSQSGKDENVTFVNDDVVAFTKELKAKAEKNIWLIGGGQINTLMLEAKLVDEIILTTIPIILGDGIPLFAKPCDMYELKLKNHMAYDNGFVQMVYGF